MSLRHLMFGLLGAIACGPRHPIKGTYVLQTVNGQRLPVRVGSSSEGGAEIVEGSIAFDPNGTYQQRILLRVRYDTLSYADSAIQVGRYEQKGGATMLQSASGSMEGQLSDSVMIIEVEGSRYRYRARAGGQK